MIIRVNGYTIDPAKVAMLDRKQYDKHSGVFVCFAAGGRKWIADPEAFEVERKFAQYDGVQEAELEF